MKPTTTDRQPAWSAHWRNILLSWFDTATPVVGVDMRDIKRIDLMRASPFVAVHLACLGVFWVGFSATALAIAAAMYALRMLAITGFYHRYFSHRSFKTSRAAQFVFALLGASTGQRGPIWWASHHRHHHARSDKPDDAHSPREQGFLWSHMGWFLAPANYAPRHELARDLLHFPELKWLDRFDIVAPLALALALYGLGAALEAWVPQLGTSGAQLLIWGFFVSTVAVYHATYTVNSLAHRFGRRRYATTDDSRNNFWIALITFGEGWHNNHHHYPASTRQGFYWWEIDLTYYVLRMLAALGIIWDLKPVPVAVRNNNRIDGGRHV